MKSHRLNQHKQHPSHRQLEHNIFKNYIYTFLSSFNITSGVWMLYLAYKGLSLFEIGLMEAIFHLTSFTMEVPTGIVADLLGRKTSRLLGRFVAILSTVMMIFSSNALGFAVSFIFSALSYNLESGAGDALIFDSMKEIGQDSKYMKVKGKVEVMFQIANAMALPLGGYIAMLDYGIVYKLAMIIGVVTFLQSLSFIEPTVGKVEQKENAMATFTHQFKDSFGIIRNSRQLSFLIIMTESFAVFATTTFYYIQNYLLMNGRSQFRIGIVLAIGALLSAVTASQAHRLEKKFGYKKTLSFVLVAGVFFLWLMVTGTYSELGIIGLSAVEALEYVVMSDYINRLIPSERRATILSMQSMVFSFFMIIIFPIVGLVGDLFSLQISFMMIAALSTLVSLIMLRKISKTPEGTDSTQN